MMGAGSFGHWAIVLLVMILLFGAGRLPKLMADLGKGFKALKTGLNDEDHHHAGIGLMPPDQVHYGLADAVHAARQATFDNAFRAHPERFVRKTPEPPAKPSEAWINPPRKTANNQA